MRNEEQGAGSREQGFVHQNLSNAPYSRLLTVNYRLLTTDHILPLF